MPRNANLKSVIRAYMATHPELSYADARRRLIERERVTWDDSPAPHRLIAGPAGPKRVLPTTLSLGPALTPQTAVTLDWQRAEGGLPHLIAVEGTPQTGRSTVAAELALSALQRGAEVVMLVARPGATRVLLRNAARRRMAESLIADLIHLDDSGARRSDVEQPILRLRDDDPPAQQAQQAQRFRREPATWRLVVIDGGPETANWARRAARHWPWTVVVVVDTPVRPNERGLTPIRIPAVAQIITRHDDMPAGIQQYGNWAVIRHGDEMTHHFINTEMVLPSPPATSEVLAWDTEDGDSYVAWNTHDPAAAREAYRRHVAETLGYPDEPDLLPWEEARRRWAAPEALTEETWGDDISSAEEYPGWVPYLLLSL